MIKLTGGATMQYNGLPPITCRVGSILGEIFSECDTEGFTGYYIEHHIQMYGNSSNTSSYIVALDKAILTQVLKAFIFSEMKIETVCLKRRVKEKIQNGNVPYLIFEDLTDFIFT